MTIASLWVSMENLIFVPYFHSASELWHKVYMISEIYKTNLTIITSSLFRLLASTLSHPSVIQAQTYTNIYDRAVWQANTCFGQTFCATYVFLIILLDTVDSHRLGPKSLSF